MDWDKIVEDIGPRLFRYFCARFSSERADDMTQETLVRLVKKVQQGVFSEEKGTLRMLSFGIARYVALESQRIDVFVDQDEEFIVQDESQGVEATMVYQDQLEFLKASIKKLSSIEQEVLSLSLDDEFTYKQISVLLEIPEGSVKSHIHRAKKKLAEIMNH